MDKKFLWSLGVVAVLVVVVHAFHGTPGRLTEQTATQVNVAPPFDPLNTTYTIDGQTVTLKNGSSSMPAAPGSASLVTTSIFGQPASGDLNGDGKADAAVMLVQNTGGSGTFFYIAAVINGGIEGTNAILLGDRIAPQNIQIEKGRIVVNYATRKSGEPMTAQPSVGVSRYFKYSVSQ